MADMARSVAFRFQGFFAGYPYNGGYYSYPHYSAYGYHRSLIRHHYGNDHHRYYKGYGYPGYGYGYDYGRGYDYRCVLH